MLTLFLAVCMVVSFAILLAPIDPHVKLLTTFMIAAAASTAEILYGNWAVVVVAASVAISIYVCAKLLHKERQ